MLVADTSSLFALFDPDDTHHDAAVREAARQRPFVVPSEILVETLATVRVRHGRQASHAVLAALKAMPHARIAATKSVVVEQAVASSLGAGPLSYPDWIVVHTCRGSGAQPWTFDDDIKRAVRA